MLPPLSSTYLGKAGDNLSLVWNLWNARDEGATSRQSRPLASPSWCGCPVFCSVPGQALRIPTRCTCPRTVKSGPRKNPAAMGGNPMHQGPHPRISSRGREIRPATYLRRSPYVVNNINIMQLSRWTTPGVHMHECMCTRLTRTRMWKERKRETGSTQRTYIPRGSDIQLRHGHPCDVTSLFAAAEKCQPDKQAPNNVSMLDKSHNSLSGLLSCIFKLKRVYNQRACLYRRHDGDWWIDSLVVNCAKR